MENSWSIPDQAGLSIAQWDDTAVVYNALSGQTHLVNELACEVLKLLQKSPSSLPVLIDNLCLIFEVEDKRDLKNQIQKLLLEFESLGLIEAV